MKDKRKWWVLFLAIVCSISLIVACENSSSPSKTSSEGETEEEQKRPEEVTLKWAYPWGEEGFQETKQKIEDHFPHVTLEYVDGQTDHPQTYEELMAAGTIPDIVQMGQVNQISVLDDLGLAYNLDELIEQTGFDLNRFEPSIIEYARNRDPNQEGGLYAIPNGRAVYSIHYNKDVFDVLGVEYPEDGMTWEETIELAKELTREVNGTQYRGLDLDVPSDAYNQFSQNSIDPETNKVLITESEAYRRYLEMVEATISIPGNYPAEKPGDLLHNWGAAWGEGIVAMVPGRTTFGWLEAENVDIVTYPVWEGYENLMPVANGGAYAITGPSEHKEIALEIIEYLMSDELQLEDSKKGGHPSVLKNPEIHEAFAQDNPQLKDKNVASMFKYENAVGPAKRSKYDDGVLWTAAIEFANSGKDINEFLRVLQEQAEENVRQQIAQE